MENKHNLPNVNEEEHNKSDCLKRKLKNLWNILLIVLNLGDYWFIFDIILVFKSSFYV